MNVLYAGLYTSLLFRVFTEFENVLGAPRVNPPLAGNIRPSAVCWLLPAVQDCFRFVFESCVSVVSLYHSVVSRTMPNPATLLFVGLCIKDVVSSAVSGGSNSSSNRNSKGRTQLVSISAPWPTSSLSPLAEASEFVAEGGSNLFWDFVEALGDAPHSVFCPPSACYSHDDSDGAAAAGEGGRRHDSPQKSTVETVVDHQTQQQEFLPPEEVAARLVAHAAMTAAGSGFGGGGSPDKGGNGATAAGNPGVGLDALSLKLLEVALSARCVSYLNAGQKHVRRLQQCCNLP